MAKLADDFVINDKWLVDNGYLTITFEDRGAFKYDIYSATEKWRKVFDDAIIIANANNSIITNRIIVDVINGGGGKRMKKDYTRQYQKKERPEGYLTMKQRHELKIKEREKKGYKLPKPNMKYNNDNRFK